MKIKVWINRIITLILALFLLFLTYTVIVSKITGAKHHILGYELKTVLSGSMEPTFMTGSVIAIKPSGDKSKFQPGDIITFKMRDKMLVTHRIVEVVKQGERVFYRTKGDNNNTPDQELVSSIQVIGQYTGFTLPYAGYFFSYASTKLGSALLLIIPGLLLIGNSILSLWREFSEIDKRKVKVEET